MTTESDAILSTIVVNWGNGGYSGDTPAIQSTTDISVDRWPALDSVTILHDTLDERHGPFNDLFVDKEYTMDIRVTSITDEDQLNLLVEEVEYLLNNTETVGFTSVRVFRKWRGSSDRRRKVFRVDMTIEFWARVSSSAISPDGGTFTAPNVIGSLVFSAGGSTVDIIRDEDNMSSDDENALVTQQSVKKYVDDQIATEDTLVELNDTDLADPNADRIVFWDDSDSKFEHLVPNTLLSITNNNLNVDESSIDHDALTNTHDLTTDIDHDLINNYDANKHVDHTAVSVIAGDGLTGGGTLAADRTLTVQAGTGIQLVADAVTSKDTEIDHDNLNNFAANEHFLKTEIGLDDLDDCGTLTGALLLDNNMFGSANKAWAPCIGVGTSSVTYVGRLAGTMFTNIDDTDHWLYFDLPLPPIKNGLKLYLDGCQVGVFQADANDYVTDIVVEGINHTGATGIDSDPTNLTTQRLFDFAIGAHDCSGYDRVCVRLLIVATGAGEMDVSSVSLRCYYAT